LAVLFTLWIDLCCVVIVFLSPEPGGMCRPYDEGARFVDSRTTRRRFLQGAGVSIGATLGMTATAPAAWAAAPTLPAPEQSGIDHIVVVMMENRSFDHYMGWLPGADGKQGGLRFTDRYGITHPTHHLTDTQGCGHPDPDHSFEGGRVELNGGRCDGWLRAGQNDDFAIGYYTADDLALYGQAGPYWTVCDRYFSAIMAETYPNRFYQHAAQTDRIHNSTATATMSTIWDRLAAAGLRGRYYYTDVPFTALWGTRYLDISKPYPEFLADCATGNLPELAFVDPKFLDEGTGSSADDHPHADIRAGQSFLDQVYRAVTSSPAWSRTLLVINYDEWGGFFDHVAPAVAPDVVSEWGLRGFRVPCLVISPRARRGHVAHDVYDHTSVLKAVEWRWNLPPLTPRDSAARNIAEVLDFSSPPDPTAPTWPVPPVVGLPCGAGSPVDYEDWNALRALAVSTGWTLP
jgi:phospholipase C